MPTLFPVYSVRIGKERGGKREVREKRGLEQTPLCAAPCRTRWILYDVLGEKRWPGCGDASGRPMLFLASSDVLSAAEAKSHTLGSRTSSVTPHERPFTMPPRLSLRLKQPSSHFWVHQILAHNAPKRTFGIKSLNPPKPSRFNVGPDLPVLKSTPTAAFERKVKANTLPLRTGALAIKKGMTAFYDPETGKRTACTVLQLDRVQVVSHKTREKHGYYAVQVGAGWKHPSNMTKSLLGHFSANGVSPKRYVQEFRVRDESGLLPIGETINADWFEEGQYVDARSNTRGMGFAGVMKRHGMGGQDRSHGVSLTHRSLGSAGPSQGGGSRVYPGKRMAGNMGNVRNTVQNLKVLKVDAENGIVVVKGMLLLPLALILERLPNRFFSTGSVSGPKGCIVKIQDAIKKPWPPKALQQTKVSAA